MPAEPSVRTCPNCGAPLELDVEGRCHWCQALVDVPPAPPAGRAQVDPFDDQLHLEPDSVYQNDSHFPTKIGLILTTFRNLGYQVAVQDYLDRAPGLRHAIRALSLALGAAGTRIRDSGVMQDHFDVSPAYYAPDDIWACDLGADVIAMLGSVEGLPGNTQAEAGSTLRTFDVKTWPRGDRLAWRNGLKQAGRGLEPFRQMRAQIPPRAAEAQMITTTRKKHFFGAR
jgi:hypothetical protein